MTTDDVPVDVVIEAGFALVAGLVGALLSTDKIQPLLSGSHEFSGYVYSPLSSVLLFVEDTRAFHQWMRVCEKYLPLIACPCFGLFTSG